MDFHIFSILLLANLFTFTFSSNILFFHLIATSSHRTAIWPLAEELANSGHNLTYIYPIPGTRVGSHPNVEEITPSKLVPLMREFVGEFDINIRLNNTYNEWALNSFIRVPSFCEAVYSSPEIDEWLQKPNLSYDLVFIDATLGECGYGFVETFKAKHVLFVPFMTPFLFDGIGVLPETSSVPDFFFHPKPNELTFWNRLSSTLITLLWRWKYTQQFAPVREIIKKKLNLEHFPEIAEFERNTSLVLVNSHFVEDYPLSLPPLVQSYSGLWCSTKFRRAKKLPEALDEFIEGGKDGFIYVSLGTSVDVSTMPVSMLNGFFQALEAFPDVRFLWKWGGHGRVEDVPKNVLLQNWFPQRDLMAHPKIKSFITQAGRPSTHDALCHAVPMINIPVFADQDYNANRLESLGVSIIVGIDSFNGTELKLAIREMFENPGYKRRMKKMSTMFKDRPLDPLENAVYWTEYVLRHDDLSLLKPLGVDQTWYQRRLIDVYLALVILILLNFSLIFCILNGLVRRFGWRESGKIVKQKVL